MPGHGEKMSRKREQAIAALLTQPTIADAAKAAGLGEKTLRRWLKLPEFAAEYEAARRELLEEAREQMKAEWRRVRQMHRDVAFRDPGDFFDEDGALKAIEEVPPHVRHSILRLKKRRTLKADGSVVELEELVLRPVEPHLDALERYFSLPPSGVGKWVESGAVAGGRRSGL